MNVERLHKVILAPHVSEKSTNVAELGNAVVFRVTTDATKIEVKNAVELLFDVKVTNVNMVNVKGKRKITARSKGKRSDWKKAYVKLQDGQEIDFIGAE